LKFGLSHFVKALFMPGKAGDFKEPGAAGSKITKSRIRISWPLTQESRPNELLFPFVGNGWPFLQFLFPMKNGRLPGSGIFCAVDWRNLTQGIPSLEWFSVQELGRVKN
jgi:hypothetical protein